LSFVRRALGLTTILVSGFLLVSALVSANSPSYGRLPEKGPDQEAYRPLPPPPWRVVPPGPGEPGGPGAERVLDVLSRIDDRMVETRYQHRTVVSERRGLYAWDCSGMAAWVLERAAPRALSATVRERPVARTFHDVIARAPTDGARRGWRRLSHVEDVRPGDVFAWRRPPEWGNRITGHVGFVLGRAVPVPQWEGAYTMRIADATSLPHQDDTRTRGGPGGYGQGTILLMTDGDGQVDSYGWFGTNSQRVVATPVVFGRVTR
jgi:hypothetical protein